ncbi:Zn-finger in Ran binding protein [Phytophthora infestans]|uniref:Zinc-finger in Ran binding protein n=1 Tax=Phytophthora infestans TaxID=4787 RepID=A0A833TET4_PHYIN|nr:Zn-finger in Ran binding protein [Phytophthora infestans]KAF4127660.1 Zinc-finger in Ran binding protein [Phytophthora infestans]
MSSEEIDSWTCPGCTLKNELIVEACAACGATSPLVLQSYAIEEQGWPAGEDAAVDGAQRASLVSHGSDNATPRNGGNEVDPWAQAECEWAQIESRQDAPSKK